LRAAASLQRQLTHLEQAGLLRLAESLPELAYLFQHALIQECAYHTMVRADRRLVHRAAGEVMEALLSGAPPSAEQAPQLGQHVEAAGDYARALRYYPLAGDAALARYANAEAAAAYSSALSAAEKLPAALPAATWQHLFEARGRALELTSRFVEAALSYQVM